jgi:hypothetical protein
MCNLEPLDKCVIKICIYLIFICGAGSYFSGPVNVPALCFLPVAYLTLIFVSFRQCNKELEAHNLA